MSWSREQEKKADELAEEIAEERGLPKALCIQEAYDRLYLPDPDTPEGEGDG